ncbi:ATP-dependent DNA helicase PIF1-like [Aphis craccivora]|uniref:ATP-dependent DNA helicase PIF1-like n=1 Tax=Aphis craccivora TaxID=307492 RepID=A0A6G0ZGG7_APHCR|nr:ATP-dependent DNA helicase PIF1-like [Aphis craccivora]
MDNVIKLANGRQLTLREAACNCSVMTCGLSRVNYQRCQCKIAAKNTDLNTINHAIQEQIIGESVVYKSINSVMNLEKAVNYPTALFNLLDLSEVSQHRLINSKSKRRIILLHNINPSRLCNGTRHAVNKL